MSDLISEQKIDLPYTYTAGAAQRAALIGLREGRLVGARGGGWLAVPAKPFAPDGTRLESFDEVGEEGVLLAVTVAVRAGASPNQNGIVGGAPWASLTRTTPDSTRRIVHDVVPSRNTSPAIGRALPPDRSFKENGHGWLSHAFPHGHGHPISER